MPPAAATQHDTGPATPALEWVPSSLDLRVARASLGAHSWRCRMPLVAHNALPTFERLRAEGEDVLSVERAETQDIRELHVGLLNMMPDAALLVTEKQYMRLIGACNRITQIYVYPFSVPGLARSEEARAHIEAYYADFEDLQAAGLDALIISGANVTNPALDLEPFWEPLAGGRHLGGQQRHEHPLLVPGHPCARQAPPRHRTPAIRPQAVGRLPPPRLRPCAPAHPGRQHALRCAALALERHPASELGCGRAARAG